MRRQRDHPAHRVGGHVRRHFVAAVELSANADVVPLRAQLRDDDPAALIDRQDLIGLTVGDEEPRPATNRRRDDESGRERRDTWKEIAVGET